MKNTPFWFVLVVLLALLGLVACSSAAENSEATPAATLGSGPIPNEAAETPEAPGETPTSGVPTGEVPGSEATIVPASPEVLSAPALAQPLLDYEVAGPDGRLGVVSGLVLDALSGRALGLVVDLVGPQQARRLLLPWGAFQVVTLPPESELAGPQAAPQVWLTASAQDMAEAPEFDQERFGDPSGRPANWFTQYQEYWAGRADGVPVTGNETFEEEGVLYVGDGVYDGVEFEVENGEGGSVGEIRDLVIGQDGTITLAVLKPNTFLGLGDGLVPVSWKTLAWIPEERVFVLNVSEDALDEAPRLDPAELPDTTVPGWEQPWLDYWKDRPASETLQATPQAVREPPVQVSRLLDHPVVDRQEEVMGSLSDWLLDQQGAGEFVLLEAGGRQVVVPWLFLGWSPRDDLLAFNGDPALMDKAPAYDDIEALESDANLPEAANQYWQDYAPVPEGAGPTLPAFDDETVFTRARALIGSSLQDPDERQLGIIDDIILSPAGEVLYLVVNSGSMLIPVPWMTVDYDPKDQTIRFIDDPLRLRDAPSYTHLEEINVTLPEWDAEIRTHWGMK